MNGTIRTRKVHTTSQLADVFTKALGIHEFESMVFKLGIYNPYALTWGWGVGGVVVVVVVGVGGYS